MPRHEPPLPPGLSVSQVFRAPLAATAPHGWGQEAGRRRARRRHSSPTPVPGAASGSAPSTPSATTPTRAGRPPPASTSRCSSTAAPRGPTCPGWPPRYTLGRGQPDRCASPSAPGVVWSDGTPFSRPRRGLHLRPACAASPALDRQGVWGFLADVKAVTRRAWSSPSSAPTRPGFVSIATQPIVAEHRWKDVAQPAAFDDPEPGGHRALSRRCGASSPPCTSWARTRSTGRKASSTVDVPCACRSIAATTEILRALRGRRAGLGVAVPRRHREALGGQGPGAPPLLVPRLRAHGAARSSTPSASPSTTPTVRKAVSLALDRPRILREALNDYAPPADATGLGESQKAWKDAGAGAGRPTGRARDVAQANKLLDAAGPGPRRRRRPGRCPARAAMRYDLHGGGRLVGLGRSPPASSARTWPRSGSTVTVKPAALRRLVRCARARALRHGDVVRRARTHSLPVLPQPDGPGSW